MSGSASLLDTVDMNLKTSQAEDRLEQCSKRIFLCILEFDVIPKKCNACLSVVPCKSSV